MKKNRNKLWAAILAGVLMAALFGCGKDSGTPQNEITGFVYAPEYAQLAIECNYINGAAAAGDSVFISTESYDEDYENHENALYKYNLMENKAEQMPFELDENSRITSMAVDRDGNLWLVMDCYEYIMDENDEITDSKSTLELCKISSRDGAVMESTDITGMLGDDEWIYIQNMRVDAQDNLYLCDGNNTIYIFNKDMQKLCDISSDGWIEGMVASKEGDVYVSYYGNEIEFKKVDVAGKKLGEAVSGIDGVNYGNDYFTGVSGSLLVSGNDDQLSILDLAQGTSEALFKWLDVDVDHDSVAYAGELSDGRIWAITREYDYSNSGPGGNSYELIYLTRKDASSVVEKEEITYGAMWLGTDLRKTIIDFNKTNEKYRIVVKEYAGEDYQAGLTQFNADLTTGNCPDILDLSSLDFNQYASKGILEDLYPYMEQSGIHKEDYLENVLKAFELDGKLYGLMSRFYITTTLAKSSLVGERDGWTLSEMLDFVGKYNPENVFAYGNRGSIFYYCIYNNIDEFIDWETGKCSFEGEEFMRVLEFAAEFPEEFDFNEAEREGLSSMLRADKLLLMQNSISSTQEYQMINGLFGEKVSFVGYPNSERKGNLIQPVSGSMGMSSKSGHKDGAWEFMKNIISQEYQDGLVSGHGGNWGFPVRKSALEKQFEQDMKAEYYEDEEGNQIEQPKTSWGYDDFQMDIMAATKEEVEGVKALITSAQKTSGYADEQLVNIITEETEPFFKGQKSAADTAGIIQNRIQIYVNENR